MIFIPVRGWTAYRMLTPKWAGTPASGAGAAEHGGRANRPGVATLYLALDEQTAIDEYRGVSTLLAPGTLVSYRVTADPILDFRAGFDPGQWPALWEEFYCDWRELWFNQHIEPPSWVLGDEAIASGAKGHPVRIAGATEWHESHGVLRFPRPRGCDRCLRSRGRASQKSAVLDLTLHRGLGIIGRRTARAATGSPHARGQPN